MRGRVHALGSVHFDRNVFSSPCDAINACQSFRVTFQKKSSTHLALVSRDAHGTNAAISVDLVHAFATIFAGVRGAIVYVRPTVPSCNNNNKNKIKSKGAIIIMSA